MVGASVLRTNENCAGNITGVTVRQIQERYCCAGVRVIAPPAALREGCIDSEVRKGAVLRMTMVSSSVWVCPPLVGTSRRNSRRVPAEEIFRGRCGQWRRRVRILCELLLCDPVSSANLRERLGAGDSS